MKNKIKFLILLIIFPIFVFSQTNIEVGVYNYSTDTIEVSLHPISAIFNGNNYYTLIAKTMIISQNFNSYNYINGIHYKQPDDLVIKQKMSPKNGTNPKFDGWNVDIESGGNSSALGTFGYGMYKIVIKNLRTERVDSCLMEFDYGGLQLSDLYFYLYDDTTTTNYRFSYKFKWDYYNPPNEFVPINYDSLRGYLAIPWEPNSFINNNHTRVKNFGPPGGFILKNFDTLSLKYNSDYFPLDSRIHCNYLNQNQNFHLIQNHAYPYPFEEPQPGYYDERHGVLTLNLTIKKRVHTPDSISIFSINNPNPTKIIVSPGVTLSVLRNEPTDNPNQDYMYNGIVLGKYYNSNTGNELIIKSQDDKYSAGKIFLGHSDDIDSNNRIIINSYASLKAEYGSTLELGENSEIDVEISSNDTLHRGKLILQNGSNLTTRTQSKIIVKHVGMFENYGANILNSSNFHLDINDGGKYHVIAENYTHTINNGAYIVVTSGTIEIANNSKLIFDGNQSYLNIKSNSNIILGQNASIEFKNGARLIANGSNFYASGSSPWQGLVFENSGQDSIINCKFTNAKIPIEIINDTITSYFTQKVIRNNTFNIQSGGQYGIKTRDAHNLLIESDSVKLPQSVNSTGIYIYNTYFPGSGDSEEELINIIIKDNVITNGSQSIIIANFTSNLLPVYIGYNKCLDATGSMLIGRLMRGAIRGNYFDNHNTSTGKGLVFHQSQPDLALNYIYSSDIAIHNLSNAVINLAPAIKDNSELLWTGGDNAIVSRLSHTIAFNHYSFAKLDRGYNELFRNNSSYHHLYGYLLIDSTRYYARENCFDGYYVSSNNLYNINSDSVTVISYSPNYTCSQSIAQTGVFVQDWGDGICDSIPVSSLNNLDSVSGDEIFYSQGLEMMTIGLYPNAIENYKQLINNKPESSYLINALYDLYTCYEELDTSVLQSNRDILYGNLKTYLESKITSGNYTEEFEDNAFQIIVMCETNMSNIELAIDDYEFLSLYHPQPEIRLLASWDYTELEALYGQGGSIKEFKSEEEMTKYIDIISKKIEKIFKGDPL